MMAAIVNSIRNTVLLLTFQRRNGSRTGTLTRRSSSREVFTAPVKDIRDKAVNRGRFLTLLQSAIAKRMEIFYEPRCRIGGMTWPTARSPGFWRLLAVPLWPQCHPARHLLMAATQAVQVEPQEAAIPQPAQAAPVAMPVGIWGAAVGAPDKLAGMVVRLAKTLQTFQGERVEVYLDKPVEPDRLIPVLATVLAAAVAAARIAMSVAFCQPLRSREDEAAMAAPASTAATAEAEAPAAGGR